MPDAGARASKQARTATADVAPPPLSSEASPADFVARQVDQLRAGKFVDAFEMNSAANKARLGSAAKFEAVVKGNASFAALADPANPCEFEVVATPGLEKKHVVRVRVKQPAAAGEALCFAFDVSGGAQEGGGKYATDGVRIEC